MDFHCDDIMLAALFFGGKGKDVRLMLSAQCITLDIEIFFFFNVKDWAASGPFRSP